MELGFLCFNLLVILYVMGFPYLVKKKVPLDPDIHTRYLVAVKSTGMIIQGHRCWYFVECMFAVIINLLL